MIAEHLKPINFSKGIHDAEINYNFNLLQEQINKERLITSGYGIAYGLDISLNGFKIILEPGSIVNKKGELITFTKEYIEQKLNYIDDIDIIEYNETLTVNEDGSIVLSHIPYSKQTYEIINTINDINDNDIICNYPNIIFKDIKDNVLIVDKRFANKQINIKYYLAQKRIDLIYISNDNEINIAKGTNSTSPSIPALVEYPNDFLFTLAYVYVEPYFFNNKKYEKKAFILPYNKYCKKNSRKYRNIFTDRNGVLYINGKPFDKTSIIYTEIPDDLTENTFYYDKKNNRLKVWINNQWIDINENKYIPTIEKKIWKPEENPLDLQTFYFEKDEVNLRFIPNNKQLVILIDNIPLMCDQYIELTEKSIDDKYDNNGIGFKLPEPLDHPATVEVIVIHTINDSPVRAFQKTNSFISNDYIEYNPNREDKKIFNTLINKNMHNIDKHNINNYNVSLSLRKTYLFYRIYESQLEVFVNGKKLIPNIDFLEGVDIPQESRKAGTLSKSFEILIDLDKIYKENNNKCIIEYKIISNIYSYDDLDAYFSNTIDTVKELKEEVQNIKNEGFNNINEKFNTFSDKYDQALNNIVTAIDKISKQVNSNMSDFIKKSEKINKDNINTKTLNCLPEKIIEYTFRKKDLINVIDIDINNTDFIIAINLSSAATNIILRKNIDYTIEKIDNKTYFNFKPENNIENESLIYLYGLKMME